MKRTIAAFGVAAATAALPIRASAQERTTHLEIGGGVAIPTARFDSTYRAGRAALIGVSTGGGDYPVGFRLDFSYADFRGKTAGAKSYRDAHFDAATLNLVVPLGAGPYIKPYLITGLGWYPFREATASRRDNDFGVNAGGGITFPLPVASGFLEARYHRIFGGGVSARRFVPIILGVTL